MPETPTVSVIVPAYNYGHFLPQAIDSVLAQTLPAREIIVVDDGSSDNTPEILSRYGDCIHVICQSNQGLTATRNRGAKLASGELLAFLDADDLWLPGKLEQQVLRFAVEPNLGLVHCGVEDVNAAGMPLRQHLQGMEGRVAAEMLLFRRPVILGGGSGVVIPRSVFTAAGGFDIRFSTSGDWDLYYRIAARYQVGFVPEVLVRYRLHGTNMHGNIRAMEHDMLLAYHKAFQDGDSQLMRLRRRAYGNLHMVLAGSFFAVGQHRDFVRHTIRSLFLTPQNLSRLLEYPIRRWRGRLESKA